MMVDLQPLYIPYSVPDDALVVAFTDVALLMFLVLSGHLLTGTLFRAREAQAAGSLVAGLALLTVSGSALLAVSALSAAPTPVLLMPTLTLAVAFLAALRRGRLRAEVSAAARSSVLSAFLVVPLALLVRLQNSQVIFSDAAAMLASGAAFASGRSDLLPLEPTTFYSFPPGVKVTHALPFLYDVSAYDMLASGRGGLLPLGLVLLAAVSVLVVHAVRSLSEGGLSRWFAYAAAGVLLTSAPVVLIAHLNGAHAPVAAFLLLLALTILATWRGEIPEGAAGLLGGLLAAGVALHRVEALVVVPLVLLAAYRLPRAPLVALSRIWQGLGVTVALWFVAALVPYLRTDGGTVQWAGDPESTVLILAAAGVATYIFGMVSSRLPAGLLRSLPIVTGAGLWLSVVAFALLDGPTLSRSLAATAENLFPSASSMPAGEWLLSGVVFTLMFAAVAASRLFDRDPARGMFAFPALVFPAAMLLAALVREGGYRVGFPDSLNRSWLHVIPLLVVAAAAAAASASECSSAGQDSAPEDLLEKVD